MYNRVHNKFLLKFLTKIVPIYREDIFYLYISLIVRALIRFMPQVYERVPLTTFCAVNAR